MAETRDEINPGAPDVTGRVTYTETHVRTATDDPGTHKAEQIEREIARTRSNMSETIDEIQERFSPQYIRRQVTEDIKDTARGAGNSIMQTIKDNPLPAAIAGLSLAWLFFKGKDEDSGYDRNYDYRTPDRYGAYRRYPASGRSYRRDAYGYPEDYRYAYREPEPHDASMKDKASEVGSKARETVHDVQERASEFGHDVQERMEDWGDQMARQARRTRSTLEHWMDENPLAMGAAALGVGALVGMMLPSTHFEDEWMGEKRDQVVEQARHKADDTIDRLEHVAEKTAETVKHELKDSAETVKETAKSEARKEGLTGGSESTSF